ncbi:MAG: hypothetical protein HY744_03415 [Deltaproteobacteria bacterium]|nr:hypothetical protein [Deltaproteobacteria bacterium]
MKAVQAVSRSAGALVALAVCSLVAGFFIGACGGSDQSGLGPTASSSGAGGASSTSSSGGAAGGTGGEAPAEISRINVEPLNAIIEVDRGKPGEQVYSAMAYYSDGTALDVSATATWKSSAVGSFEGATLKIPPTDETGAITTMISAELEGATGQAQLTVVTYRMTGPATDFFFILPYEEADKEQVKPLDFSTDVKTLDVFFNMDTTGSMDEEIKNLQLSLQFLVIPAVKKLVKSTWFGAGAFMDFPFGGYGSLHGTDCGGDGRDAPDQPFELFQAMTSKTSLVQAGVDAYADVNGNAIGCGGVSDRPESMIEALYQTATGEGMAGPGDTFVLPNHDGVGGVGFRKGSMPAIVTISDAPAHTVAENGVCDRPPPFPDVKLDYQGDVAASAHTRQHARDALDKICGKVVGVAAIDKSVNWPDNCYALVDLEDFAIATGARVPPEAWDLPARPEGCPAGKCCTDFGGTGRDPDLGGMCPLVFKVDQNGTGLSNSIATGLQMLTRYAKVDVVADTVGEDAGMYGEVLPPGTTTADFIVKVTPDHFTKPQPPPEVPDPTITADGFLGVTPGTIVSFNVTAVNHFVPEINKAQFFRATIRVLAGGCTKLDERVVFILVPPTPIEIPK